MLKSVLALLLSKFVKKADTEFIASQVMPISGNVNRTIIYQGLESKNGTYVPPCSGYLCIDGGNKINYIELGDSPRIRIPASGATAPLGWPQIYMPVKKGKACHYKLEVFSGITESSTIYFIPAVGGQTS